MWRDGGECPKFSDIFGTSATPVILVCRQGLAAPDWPSRRQVGAGITLAWFGETAWELGAPAKRASAQNPAENAKAANLAAGVRMWAAVLVDPAESRTLGVPSNQTGLFSIAPNDFGSYAVGRCMRTSSAIAASTPTAQISLIWT